MPLALQLVQAVLFTPEPPSPLDVFSAAFGIPPAQFQQAPPPALGSVAVGIAHGRNLVLQSQPGRVDLFAAAVDPGNPEAVPGQFAPVHEPEAAIDQIESAIGTVAARLPSINRLAFVLRYVESVPDANRSADRFSELTGLPRDRVGLTDNILQVANPSTLPDLPSSVLNLLCKWQTERIMALSISFAPGTTVAPAAGCTIEHHAISLNVDVNVIPQDGAIPLPRVDELLHRLREIAVETGGTAAARRVET